jgi:hypothetical protein
VGDVLEITDKELGQAATVPMGQLNVQSQPIYKTK